MKRCIVCGNIGSDDSTVCSECGNAMVEMGDTMDGDSQEDSLEKMEEQLKAMWARVQGEDEDSPAAQETAEEPELTVISEEPEALEAEKAAKEIETTGGKDVQEAAAENIEAEAQTEAVSQEAADAEIQTESAVQEAADAELKAEPAAQRAVDMDALMKAAAKKTADSEAGTGETAEKASSAFLETTADTTPAGTQAAQRMARTQTRRAKGPQIYGQESMAEYSGAQGVIRRDVQGGHTAASQMGAGTGAGSGRSASRPPRRPVSSPVEETGSVQSVKTEMAGEPQANASGMQGNPARAGSQAQRMSAPPSYQQPPQGGQGHGQHGGKHQGTARRIMEAARTALSSPLLIVIALFQTVYFASAVAAIFLRQLNYEQTAKLLALLPIPSQISGYISMLQAALAQLDSGALVMNLVIRVPDLLFCLALWALIITVRSAGEKMSGSGFFLMKFSAILNMIASCVALLLVLVVCVIFVIAAWNAGTTSLITLAVATLILAMIAAMAVIMYFFCYLSTIKAVRKNAVSGERYGKVSVYVAVVKMVTALTAIISILSGIVNSEITGITTGVGQLGWMILFGIWILRYKNTLSEYED